MVALLALTAGCRREQPTATTGMTRRGGELVASVRSEPRGYNRLFDHTAAGDLFCLLTQARLVRINRATDALEPALAESWTQSADGAYTLRIRPGVRFSDGTPLTSADVLFSLELAYDRASESVLGPSLQVAGKPLQASAPDPATVVIRFPEPFAPGVRILDNLPILPKHKLDAAFRAGTVRQAWTAASPVSEVVGLGPFILTQHMAGQRMIFSRNPHYWRRGDDQQPLPYLDGLTLEVIPDQNAEALRLESGALDLMANADLRADDVARFRALSTQGRIKLLDLGASLDPNLLWFNLKASSGRDLKPWLRTREFRQALASGVDRQAYIDTVYLGAGIPVFGPVMPGNTTWFSASAPRYSHDPAKARRLLAAAGLTDQDGDGLLEDGGRRPVRFSVLFQAGHTIRERSVTVLQEQFRRLGIQTDLVGLDPGAMLGRWQSGDYDSIFHGFQASATDPAMTLDFWLSSGSSHVWNPDQAKPATGWEAEIDDLMRRQVGARDLADRQRLFAEVQRVFGEEVPALYIATPRVTAAVSPRTANVTPAALIPQLLWAADTLVAAPAASR